MASQEKISKGQTFTSTLVCQRCSNPLKLNFSFKEIDDEVFDELSHPSSADQDDRNMLLQIFQKRNENRTMRKVMIPAYISEAASDFMVVGEFTSLPLENVQSLKVTDAILSLTSDQSSVDHPLCEDCTDKILDQMDSQLRVTNCETVMYKSFLNEVEDDDDEDVDSLQAVLNELKKEESGLEATLEMLEGTQEKIKTELEFYKEEAEGLDEKERKHWNAYFQIEHKNLLAEDDEHSVNNQLIFAQEHLKKFSETNVFSTTFHIWHSGHFGTINNFRLGRLPDQRVEWAEINSAWGQTVLLLHSLATKINLVFSRYKLVPYGTHSYIVPLDNKNTYLPLYCLGGKKYVLDNRFDDAMVAFLDCLQQFKEKVESYGDNFHLPYEMHRGKIEVTDEKGAKKSYSIKINLNSEEQWTKALKFMLTNLKWALYWVSDQFQ